MDGGQSGRGGLCGRSGQKPLKINISTCCFDFFYVHARVQANKLGKTQSGLKNTFVKFLRSPPPGDNAGFQQPCLVRHSRGGGNLVN